MKIHSILTGLLSLVFSITVYAQVPKDYAVLAEATVSKSPASITLKWPKLASGVTQYQIFRKAKQDVTWGTVKVTLSNADTMWIDTDVKVGTVYEYNVQKRNGTALVGVSYLQCGIEVPVVHNRGSVLVVVESELAKALPTELNTYLTDLAADGWKVFAVQVSKTDSVTFVKREIKRFDKMAGGLQALFLLGHVPVPYSGIFGKDSYYTVPPDGHPDHSGCWPTDMYYAIDFDQWADAETVTSGITRKENQNLPGDGKFDNIRIPGTVKYYTGRVDLSNMPKFSLSESDLTKRYFTKAHNFRYGVTNTVSKAVIDENFSASYGAFSSTGWRNFSAMFGAKNIIEGDLFTNCATDNLLFAYGAGGGSYTSCGGVGVTDDFVTKKPAVFNMLFGSYFGDWDVSNSFLRGPLASPENGLTSAWSGRPYWQNHPMALGEPVGYCALMTQNNSTTYAANVFENVVTINLLGDPTLRLHVIKPPTNVTTTALSTNTKVQINWTASPESGVLGYYVYRSSSPYGNYFPLNSTLITTTTYTDNAPFQGTNHYLVKAVKLTTSSSGSYYNTSMGAAASISGITGAPASVEKVAVTMGIFPNPSNSTIQLGFSQYVAGTEAMIYSMDGQLVRSLPVEPGTGSMSAPMDISDLAPGMYIIRAGSAFGKLIKN